MPGYIRLRIGLAKVPLCLLIGCSSVFGYILADPTMSLRVVSTGFGMFVLATGAATLNSLQEYRLDSEFQRTKNRPLPKGLLSRHQAGTQASVLLLAGLVILFVAFKIILPLLAAVFAVVLYNGIYTPLKRKTILAIFPGAICGAFPPYIGWLGAGGEAFSYTVGLLIALFVLWQIPHFWLVLLTFKDDYERSRFPNFLKQFREESLKRFFATWISSLVAVMLMFLTLPEPLGWCSRVLIILNGSLLLVGFFYGLVIQKINKYRFLFILLNFALFLHMLILAVGRVLA